MNSYAKRHGDENSHADPHNSHYANLSYGSLIFEVMAAYIVAVIILKKLYYHFKMFRSSLEEESRYNLKVKKLIDNFVNLNPYLHLPVIIALSFGCKFFDLNITKMSVYFKKIARLSYVLTFTNLFLVIPRSGYFFFMSYLDSIRLHVWLSCFILVMSTVHSLFFMFKWLVNGNLIKKLFKFQNFVGLLIFIITLILLVISLTNYRRKHYENFYLLHQLGMFSFVILTIVHADPQIFTPFGILNLGFLVVMIVNRFINTSQADGEDPFIVTEVKKYGTLKTVYFSNDKIGHLDTDYLNEDSTNLKFIPGSHIRLHESGFFNWKYWLKPSHPFTLVANNQLIIKQNEFSKFNNIFQANEALNLVGLYNPNESVECMLQEKERKKINIVAGGSGISFALPILKTLLTIDKNKELERNLISLHWSVRKIEDAFIIPDFLKSLKNNEVVGISQFSLKLHITGTENFGDEEQKENLTAQLIQYKELFDFDILHNIRFAVATLAPEEESLYLTTFKQWIVCCGPSAMIDECKHYIDAANFKIADVSANNRNYIDFISEVYEF